VEARVAKLSKSAEHFQPFGKVAREILGDTIATNIMMLGYAWQSGLVPLSLNALLSAIELNGVALEANQQAFYWGRKLRLQPGKFTSKPSGSTLSESSKSSATASESTESLDLSSLDGLVAHRRAHLTKYQNSRLAKRYGHLVSKVSDRCNDLGLDDSLPLIVAREYSRLLTYKDEYEVARLYSTDAFRQQLNTTFEGDFTIKVHLAPPVLNRTGSNGRPEKRSFGAGILTLFRVLQHGKKLRGTALDVFGYTAERRRERRLIAHYEEDIEHVLNLLSVSTHNAAKELLDVPSQIRGFGVVKEEAMSLAYETRKAALISLNNIAAKERKKVA